LQPDLTAALAEPLKSGLWCSPSFSASQNCAQAGLDL
jgi:hypothetical protein